MSLTRGQLPVRLTTRVEGAGPDGEEIKYRGTGCAVLRAQSDGTWRIAANAWHLGPDVPL
jgi:hypothetical protein